MSEREICEHDYRARFDTIGSVYRAVCEKCRDDAGVVDLSGVTVLSGYVVTINHVTCLDCGWTGHDFQLKAQACPVCDGRCADV